MSETKTSGKFTYRKTPLEKVLTVIGLIFCLIFGFLLTCNLTIIVKGVFQPEEPPSVLGITPMIVLSGSMSGEAEDHIEVGDLIFVGPAKAENLQAGDIIAFMEGTTVITHRIVEVQTENGLQFITQGDANNTPDARPVTAANLVGIYRFRIPGVGNFAMFLQTPVGMLVFIGIPLLAFVIYDIIRRQRYVNRERQRRKEVEADLKRLHALMGKPNQSSGDKTP